MTGVMRSVRSFFVSLLGSVLLLVWLVSGSPSQLMRYQAPDECKWYLVMADGGEQEMSLDIPDNQEVALVCRVRTINSEIEKTNFSVIQPQYTVKLRIMCESCKLNNITAAAFRGLRQLRNLTIVTHNDHWSNAISLHVPPDVFADELQLLERLDLGSNNIAALPDAVFCPLQSLTFLNLTRNKLAFLEILRFDSDEECAGVGNLRVLDLSNNSIEALQQKVFSRLLQLQELHLQHNVISMIADHAFDSLSSLSVLNLAHNKLVFLPPGLFSDSSDLKEVHLQNNSLNTLAPGLFHGLAKLLVLDLSHNQLTEEWINSATFTGLVSLIMLKLSANKINKLDAFTFRDLHQLRVLRLESNSIDFIQENVFSSLHQLNTLGLSNNQLKHVDAFTFDGVSTAIALLALDNNQIASIDEHAFRNFSNLEELHLNGNQLEDIPAALKNTFCLRTLDLGNNCITDLTVDSFPALNQLVGLRLAENNISRMSKSVFKQLGELQIINLSSNKIERIEPGSFDGNQKVVAIRIDGNCLTEVGSLFSNLPNLVWLNMSENFLEWFDYSLVPTGLQWLDVHSNRIAMLGNHFEIENQLQLSVFDASDNRLTEITGSSIPDHVQNLVLANNHISKIQSYAFFKKFNLARVDLSGNQLKVLTPHSLRISSVPGGKALPEFLISNNPFQCDCSMQWLQTYTVGPDRNKPLFADLYDVHCEQLYNRAGQKSLMVPLKLATPDQFLCRYELECAKRSLCDCCDFDACDCKVVCPPNCTCYHSMAPAAPFANVVSCTRAGYSGGIPVNIPMNVTQLYLDGNDHRVLSSHSFIGRKWLKVLFLNGSNVEIIHNRTFYGLRELEMLRLEVNHISWLTGSEFDGLDKLRELYLHHNKISFIQPKVFLTLYTLSVLTLDNNRMLQFPIWKLPSSLSSVTLSGNPWTCDCQFVQRMHEYLTQYLKSVVTDAPQVGCLNSSSYFVAVVSENLTALCVQPMVASVSSNVIEGALNGNLSSVKDSSARRLDLYKYYKYFLPVTVIAISALVFGGVLLLLVYLYKDELRIWWYSKFGVRLFYPRSREIEMDDRDKLFDAFVSYSVKDEIFVAEELAPVLENGDPPYTLCLHYREFPIGGYLSDTIVQAAESSRRTILVLSENFVKSEWSLYEFKSAHHQVLRDRCKRLIVILLGDVLPRDLDPDLGLYMKNKTYLQWGEKLFWEKLRFALPDVPNNQRHKKNNPRQMHAHYVVGPHHHSSSLHGHHHGRVPNCRSVAIHTSI